MNKLSKVVFGKQQSLLEKCVLFLNCSESRNYSSNVKSNVESLTGVFPSLPTPFKRMKNEVVSFKNLEKNLLKWSSLDFAGYSFFGYYGEYPYLTREERLDITKMVRNLVGNQKTIIVGSSSESLKKTIEICELMKKSGADYSLIFTPHYYKRQMTYKALLEYFTKVADHSPCPVIIHNIPSVTFIDLPAELVIELSEHPNIVGYKECSHNIAKIACICEQLKSNRNNDFAVLSGSASFILDSVRVGAVGSINVLACILGEQIVELFKLALQEQKLTKNQEYDQIINKKFFEKILTLQNSFIEPDLALTENFGIPGLKAALDAYGFYGGPCRLPLLDLSENEAANLEMVFKKNGFDWPTSFSSLVSNSSNQIRYDTGFTM